MRITMWWVPCLWFVLRLSMVSSGTSCRFTMKEPRGVITTPNFPGPYPVPINCQWVIEAPTDKVIAVYFTQFYMREGLKATEYAYYSPNVKMGKTEFGTISSEREPTYLVSNKPVLVLDFNVREMANIHMRVREYLLDVFGFNITYEFLSRNESVRKDACLYHHCSFTGNCYAASGYDRYYCSCFSKYSGEECQYDTECGPEASRNMCQNGGTCRYYIGSTVRTCECPPNYDGARCESRRMSPEKNECYGEECNATCSKEPATGGAASCIENKRKMRYIVSLKLTNPKVNSILSEKKFETFKKEMEHALSLAFKGRLEVMENITVLEVKEDSTMIFHIFATKEDDEEVRSTIDQMLQVGKLGSFDFDSTFQEIFIEPALRIDRIEASEMMPVAEGTELTLACMIEGTSDMKVEWLRDIYPLHIHSSGRSMWNTIVPKNSQEQYTALLGFDRVSSLDTGIFTCQVTDLGFVQNRSISIYVLSAPQPQLSPMTATLTVGSPLVITCISREDIYGDFGYTWLKNGQVLNPSSEPEMAEDLFPAGSRILLQEVKYSSTYSCIITSSAGSTRKDSVITVIEEDGLASACPTEDYLKVRWTNSAGNTENVQPCPTGYTGDVRRKCSFERNGVNTVWEEPDFSGCFSSGFVSLKKKVDTLRLGYLISDTAALLTRLKRYLMSKKQKLHFCEGEPIVDILSDINNIKHGERKYQDAWPTFLDIASTLLESPILIKKQNKFLELHNLIFSYGFHFTDSSEDISFEMFQRSTLAVMLGKLPGDIKQPMNLSSKRFASVSKHPDNVPRQYAWMTNSVELDLSEVAVDQTDKANSTGSFVVVFYKNVSSYLPQRFFTRKGNADVEYQLISSLVAVRVNSNYKEENFSIRVSLTSYNHTVNDKHVGWNISCAMADFKHGSIHFSTDHCHLIWSVANHSICQCNRIGTYALLLTHYALPEEVHSEMSFDAIAGSGCAICAFLLLLTLFMLLSLWKKIRGAITALKIQVCVALLGAFTLFLWGLIQPFSEELYSYSVSLIQFFLLTAFSLQLCLALTVYIQNVELKNVQYSFTKIFALGWAIPVIIVGATLAAQSLEGYTIEGWWLTLGSNFFYAYTSSILILTMFQVLLFLVVKTEVRNFRKVADYLHGKKIRTNNTRITLLHRSLLLTSTLLFMSMSSILYMNFKQKVYEYLFAVSSVLLGLVVFLTYTVCSEKDAEMKESSESCKSFLKPEIVDDNYSRKMNIDVEKRAERIKRMYSQIEKASLADSLQRCDAASDLLSSHHPFQQESATDESHTPIFKPYQHAVDPEVEAKYHQSIDPICDPINRTEAYPKMHWRYASHPHQFVTLDRKNQQPVLLDSSDYSMTLPSTFHQVKAEVSCFVEGSEDSLRTSCFMQHTDSLETVVHCGETAVKSEAPMKTISNRATAGTAHQSWNMTTV